MKYKKIMSTNISVLPKLSIIIPVYNVEAYIDQCLQSVLTQTFKDIEILLIDDGSTDKCGEICDSFAKNYDFANVIHQKNQGLSVARNVGISIARGQYIMFLDSDDELGDSRMLEAGTKLLDNDLKTDFIQFPIWWYRNNNMQSPPKYSHNIIFEGSQCILEAFENDVIVSTICDKIFRRSVFINIRFPVGRFFEDDWIFCDMLPLLKKVILISVGYYKYNIRQGSITQSALSKKKGYDRLTVSLRTLSTVHFHNKESLPYVRRYLQIVHFYFKYFPVYPNVIPYEITMTIQYYAPSYRSIYNYRKVLLTNNIIKIVFAKVFGLRKAASIVNLITKKIGR